MRFRLERRRYGKTVYTWVYLIWNGERIDLGDPWPGWNPPRAEIMEAANRKLAERAVKGMACPFCGGLVFPADGAFLEMGEYDGKEYTVEGNVGGYQCLDGHGFYAWPGGKAVTTEELQ